MGGRREFLICGGLAAIVVSAVFVAHLIGVSFYVITGGSMEGAIPKGAVAIERSVPTSTLQVGDVITFQPPKTKGSVTHRIIGIDADEAGRRVYATKGDANEAADPWRFTLDGTERRSRHRLPCLLPGLPPWARSEAVSSPGRRGATALVVWFRESAESAEDESFADDGMVQP